VERSLKHCCSGKAVSIISSEFVCVVLVIQHALRGRHIVMSSAVCVSLKYLPTLSDKRHDFLIYIYIYIYII